MLLIACSACAAGVADPNRLRGVQVLSDLAAQEHEVAGHDGLGEVVVEPLVGVGVRVLN